MPDGAQTIDLIRYVFPSFDASEERDRLFESRAILAPHNRTVDDINADCLALFPGKEVEYRSIDTIPKDEDAQTQFPLEALNSLDPPGLPKHRLFLKVGVPVMLLRNLHPPRLCNGTRLILTKLEMNVLAARIASGAFKGEPVLLPRIPLEPSVEDLPVRFRRLQFPVRPCFAITVHKSQGQSLDFFGVHLGLSCFQHGQLYVALSRARDPKHVKVLLPGRRTQNVVLKAVLSN